MKVYHRQALEDRIVNMAHKRDAAAKLLLTEVFYGTPGSLVGVIVCNPDKLSIVFLARATHPDEPIPHFKNLEYSMSTVLNGAAANLKHHTLDAYVTPDELRRIARALPQAASEDRVTADSMLRVAQYIIDGIPEATRVLIIPKYGFIALNPDRIVATLDKPGPAEEVYRIWKQVQKKKR